MRITIQGANATIEITLVENSATRTLSEMLPLHIASFEKWGEEIYFTLPEKIPTDELTTDLSINDIGIWPSGNCFCIFYGRTPMSTSDAPMPASGVAVIGKITAHASNCHIIEGPLTIHAVGTEENK